MAGIILSVTSFAAFQIELKFDDMVLATGTAFFASSGNRRLLVTNKHNVTGRNIQTGDCLDTKNAAIPNNLGVLIPITKKHKKGFTCADWQRFSIPLYPEDKGGSPAWVEHPDPLVDLVGFKFAPKEINIERLVLPADGYDIPVNLCSSVNIIGYPFGVSTDNFPLWITGHIASEPAIDINGRPLMYIDSRTRQGQSGSPVVKFYNPGESVHIDGKTYQAKQPQVYLLGIYSGRVHPESDIGMVWKKSAIRELFAVAEKNET
jgi:hypothetical protein